MATSPSTLWDDVLAQVRLNHPSLVRGWFSELDLAGINAGVLVVKTCNGAQTRYLEQHCRGALLEAAQAATGRLISVEFEPHGTADGTGMPDLSLVEGGETLPLNPDYTFDHFVTGPCNRLAHAAAIAVAEDPGRSYNPFFVYGPVGLGKTHLLQAICHAARERNGHARHLYLSCEAFINHFMEAVEQGALHQFRYRYRHVDLLVIDDIQFLAERERSQEEFFHTFNTLHQSQRQIILSADCSPAEIPSLEERLISRFNSGLVALLDRPCLETRMAILSKKAKLRGVVLPDGVIRLVAGRIDANIRELEGALVKLDALSQAQGVEITADLAAEALGTVAGRPIRIHTILEVVSKHFELKVTDLVGQKRLKAFTHPRHVAMYLARELTPQSFEAIGAHFGGRDHSTVLHAHRAISRAAETDAGPASLLDDLAKEVRMADE